MDQIIQWLIFVLILAAILAALSWLASRARRRGVGHQVSGPVDMIFRPHTYDMDVEVQIQEQRMQPQLPVDGKLKVDRIDRPANDGNEPGDPR